MTLTFLFIFLFFEEIIIALSVRFFSIGGGALLLVFFAYILLNYFTLKIKISRVYSIFIYVLFFILVLITALSLDVTTSTPGLLVLISGTCLITYMPFNKTLKIPSSWINLIYFICILSTLVGISVPSLDVYSIIEGVVRERPSGLFREPSHASYYYFLLGYVSSQLFPQNRSKYFYLTTILYALNFSLTSFLMFIVTFINYIDFSIFKSKIFLSVSSFALMLSLFNLEKIQLYLMHRLPSLDLLSLMFKNSYDMIGSILYLSSIKSNPTFATFTYYWSMLLHYLPFNYFGFGFDNFYLAYLEYSENFPNPNVAFMAQNGGFLLVTLIVEFGTILTFMFLVFYFKQFKKPSILLYASLSYLLFRGWGLSPLLFWSLPLFSRPNIYPSSEKL